MFYLSMSRCPLFTISQSALYCSCKSITLFLYPWSCLLLAFPQVAFTCDKKKTVASVTKKRGDLHSPLIYCTCTGHSAKCNTKTSSSRGSLLPPSNTTFLRQAATNLRILHSTISSDPFLRFRPCLTPSFSPESKHQAAALLFWLSGTTLSNPPKS
jgi:hypothetical protein